MTDVTRKAEEGYRWLIENTPVYDPSGDPPPGDPFYASIDEIKAGYNFVYRAEFPVPRPFELVRFAILDSPNHPYWQPGYVMPAAHDQRPMSFSLNDILVGQTGGIILDCDSKEDLFSIFFVNGYAGYEIRTTKSDRSNCRVYFTAFENDPYRPKEWYNRLVMIVLRERKHFEKRGPSESKMESFRRECLRYEEQIAVHYGDDYSVQKWLQSLGIDSVKANGLEPITAETVRERSESAIRWFFRRG